MNLNESKMLIEELMKTNENLEKNNIALEMEVRASKRIIHKLKIENKLLAEYEDKDDLIMRFEKVKVVAVQVIQNLKEEINLHGKELDDVKKIKDENDKLNSEKETLEKEIVEINKENISKEEILLAVKVEMIAKNC